MFVRAHTLADLNYQKKKIYIPLKLKRFFLHLRLLSLAFRPMLIIIFTGKFHQKRFAQQRIRSLWVNFMNVSHLAV